MLVPALAFMGLAGLVASAAKKPTARDTAPAAPAPAPLPSPRAPLGREQLVQLIAGEAQRVGVDPRVTLAFAELESQFNPAAEGDLNWPFRRDGALYRKHVLESPHLANNPYRLDPSVWHSYGLFQLLSPYYVLEHEHPRALLDPMINTERGVRAIKRVLERAGGNVYLARRLYVGCSPGTECAKNTDEIARIDGALARALQKWWGVA